MLPKVTTHFRRILLAFRERKKSSIVPFSSVIDKVNTQTLMTRTGVTVTAIFVLTMPFSFVHYCLSETGIVDYIINSLKQKNGAVECLSACRPSRRGVAHDTHARVATSTSDN